ncbi:MAG TPA: EpsI family protein, partial [Albitalea sp.]|nr:EpsI family protein [Albitalea sp.]
LAVTQLHATKIGRSEPVTYWIVFGDSVVNDGAAHRWRQLTSGLRGEIRDGMLVRISSLTRDAQQAYRLHSRFTDSLLQVVSRAHHDRVFGAVAA